MLGVLLPPQSEYQTALSLKGQRVKTEGWGRKRNLAKVFSTFSTSQYKIKKVIYSQTWWARKRRTCFLLSWTSVEVISTNLLTCLSGHWRCEQVEQRVRVHENLHEGSIRHTHTPNTVSLKHLVLDFRKTFPNVCIVSAFFISNCKTSKPQLCLRRMFQSRGKYSRHFHSKVLRRASSVQWRRPAELHG